MQSVTSYTLDVSVEHVPCVGVGVGVMTAKVDTSDDTPEVARELVIKDRVGSRRELVAIGDIDVVDASKDNGGVMAVVISTEDKARTGEDLDVVATTEGKLVTIGDNEAIEEELVSIGESDTVAVGKVLGALDDIRELGVEDNIGETRKELSVIEDTVGARRATDATEEID